MYARKNCAMRQLCVAIPILLAACTGGPPPATVVVEAVPAVPPPSAVSSADPAPLAPAPPAIETPGQQGCFLSGTAPAPIRFRADARPFVSLSGASATFDLTTAGPGAGAVVRAVVRGFTVQGLAAANDLPIGPARAFAIGGFVVPGPEARLTWKATAPGSITLGYTPDESIEVLPEARPVGATLPCDAIALEPSGFEARGAAPHGAKEHEALLAAGKRALFARTPEGPPVVKLKVGDSDMVVTVVETRGRRALVRVDLPTSVLFGWLAASDLRPMPKDFVSESFGVGCLGLSGIGPTPTVQKKVQCDDMVALVAEVAGERRTVGSVAAGAMIALLPHQGDLVPVALPMGLTAEEGATVGVLASHVAGCAQAR